MHQIFEENYSCYGARKMWAAINREGHLGHVARCTVERLMAIEGLRGIRRRKKKTSTRSADADACPEDLVDRDFEVEAPNKLWVADITYISTSQGWVHAAFVLDAFSREVVGWQIPTTCGHRWLEMHSIWGYLPVFADGEDVSGLIHHSDRGVQYRSIVYGEALAESDVVASVGSKGDSYDNAMAEALN